MARDDYGAISVISDDEREALGIGGRPDDEDEEGMEAEEGEPDPTPECRGGNSG